MFNKLNLHQKACPRFFQASSRLPLQIIFYYKNFRKISKVIFLGDQRHGWAVPPSRLFCRPEASAEGSSNCQRGDFSLRSKRQNEATLEMTEKGCQSEWSFFVAPSRLFCRPEALAEGSSNCQRGDFSLRSKRQDEATLEKTEKGCRPEPSFLSPRAVRRGVFQLSKRGFLATLETTK